MAVGRQALQLGPAPTMSSCLHWPREGPGSCLLEKMRVCAGFRLDKILLQVLRIQASIETE